jgi:hypothetical protein
MRKRYAILALIAALALPVVVVEADTETKVCPDGQELVSVKAGDLALHNDKALPPGAHFEDEVSGSGPDYTVRSDRDSATVQGDRVLLVLECR